MKSTVTTAFAILLATLSFATASLASERPQPADPLNDLAGNVDCALRAENPKRFTVVKHQGERIVTIMTSANTHYWYSQTAIVRCDNFQEIPCMRLSSTIQLRNAHRFLERSLRREAYKSKSWKCPYASTNVRSSSDPDGWVVPSRF